MKKKQYLIFTIDNQYIALPITVVQHVMQAVQPVFPPDAPDLLLGLINMGGKIVPILNIRKQFHMPEKEIDLYDRIIICQFEYYTIAFIADTIENVVDLSYHAIGTDSSSEILDSNNIFPGMENFIKGVAKYNAQTVLVYDIKTIFPTKDVNQIMDDIHDLNELS